MKAYLEKGRQVLTDGKKSLVRDGRTTAGPSDDPAPSIAPSTLRPDSVLTRLTGHIAYWADSGPPRTEQQVKDFWTRMSDASHLVSGSL